MSEYKDPWLMCALLIEFDKTKEFAQIVDYLEDLSLEQKLVVARYLISPRMMEESQLAQAWEKPIIRGVTLRDAALARLRTSTINQLADALGVTYDSVYSGILPKLKKWEQHKGLKSLFAEYNRRIEEREDKKGDIKPITEKDLFKFESDVEYYRFHTNGKTPNPSSPGSLETLCFERLAEIEDHVAEFKRWLTGEDRALFA